MLCRAIIGWDGTDCLLLLRASSLLFNKPLVACKVVVANRTFVILIFLLYPSIRWCDRPLCFVRGYPWAITIWYHQRIGKAAIQESALIKPIFGAAGRMETMIASEAAAPALKAAAAARPTLRNGFRADLHAAASKSSGGFANLGKPNFILTNKLYR